MNLWMNFFPKDFSTYRQTNPHSSLATLLNNIWTNNLTCEITSAIATDPISDHLAFFDSQCFQANLPSTKNFQKLENSIILI